MLTLQQSTSTHANIDDDGGIIFHPKPKPTRSHTMSLPRLKKYKIRHGPKTNSLSLHSDNLHTPSITHGYSSSDQSSNSRTQQRGTQQRRTQPRDTGNEIQFFHPDHLPRLKIHHQNTPERHTRSSTLPEAPNFILNNLFDRKYNHKQQRPLSAVAPKTKTKKRRKKKPKVTHPKPSHRTKQHSARRPNTKIDTLQKLKLERSDTAEYGGPKPFFVTRTPVTTGPFSPNVQENAEQDMAFPDTQWVAQIESPQTFPRSPPQNPFAPRRHNRGVKTQRSQRCKRIKPPRTRPQLSMMIPRDEIQAIHHSHSQSHGLQLSQTPPLTAIHRSQTQIIKRNRHKKPPRHKHGMSMDLNYNYNNYDHCQNRQKHVNIRNQTVNVTPPTVTAYGNYTGYPGYEQKQRKTKKNNNKRNFMCDYHIVDLDNDDWIFSPDIDDTILYQ